MGKILTPDRALTLLIEFKALVNAEGVGKILTPDRALTQLSVCCTSTFDIVLWERY